MSNTASNSAGDDDPDREYPRALGAAERKALVERRRATGQIPPEGDDPGDDFVGFGLSGGGIRSATFSLGVFQALAQSKLIRKIDFLSTVSGGGYFGSFLGRLFTRSDDELKEAGATPRRTSPKIHAELVEAVLMDSHTRPVKWLRENGRYLSPNGSGDMILGVAVILRNWLSMHVVLATFVLMQFLMANLVRVLGDMTLDVAAVWLGSSSPAKWLAALRGFTPLEPTGWILWSPYMLVPAAILTLAAVPLGWAYWVVPHKAERREIGRGIPQLLFVLIVLAISLATVASETKIGWDVPCVPLGMAVLTSLWSALTIVYELLSRWESRCVTEQRFAYRRNRLSYWLAAALMMTGLTAGFALLDSLGQTLYACLKHLEHIEWKWADGFAAGVVAVAAGGRQLALLVQRSSRGPRVKLSAGLVAGSVGVLLALVILVSLSAVAHAVTWDWKAPTGDPGGVIAGKIKNSFGGAAKQPKSAGDRSSPAERAAEPAPAAPVRPGDGAENSGTQPPGTDAGATPQSSEPNAESTAETREEEQRDERALGCLAAWLAGSFLLALGLGYSWPFLNQSSQQSMYNARLTRAYQGASNPKRWKDGGAGITRVIDGDSISLADYAPHSSGGPLHLVNVTVNETVDSKSQVEQRDRKGLAMAIGPCGISVGTNHHATWYHKDKQLLPPFFDKTVFQIFEDVNQTTRQDADRGARCSPISVEPMELGQWVGVSGAAFSTGIGARTSLGMSLLCGIFNIRLGYWWNSGVNPADREPQTIPSLGRRLGRALTRMFPVQMYLLDEFTARFHGPARQHWYLSDGGHFENMGGYELVRRRLPLIVICDGEQDASYTFEGLANFVRKARTDFGAEIEFFTEKELDEHVDGSVRHVFGTLEQLRRGEWSHEPVQDPLTRESRLSVDTTDQERLSLAHAALAWVRYHDHAHACTSECTSQSILVYVKASLTGDEPADLRQYHNDHPDFPHEPTSDQYFDEAQWESYRKLGEHIGQVLFRPGKPLGARWCPAELDPRKLLKPTARGKAADAPEKPDEAAR